MDENIFFNDYLKPVDDRFNHDFKLPLPEIQGLKSCGDFILQGHKDGTFSTNIIKKYEKENGVTLFEIYKNTENAEKEIFIRLVGTMLVVKKGYPFFILDAAVSNLNFFSGHKENITTRIAVHFPQANNETHKLFFENLNNSADNSAIPFIMNKVPSLPEFWGHFWSAQFQGVAFDHITKVRSMAWQSYDKLCRNAPATPNFDYFPAQYQMIFNNANAEYLFFRKMGLSVAVEAQAAFFSILTSGL